MGSLPSMHTELADGDRGAGSRDLLLTVTTVMVGKVTRFVAAWFANTSPDRSRVWGPETTDPDKPG